MKKLANNVTNENTFNLFSFKSLDNQHGMTDYTPLSDGQCREQWLRRRRHSRCSGSPGPERLEGRRQSSLVFVSHCEKKDRRHC